MSRHAPSHRKPPEPPEPSEIGVALSAYAEHLRSTGDVPPQTTDARVARDLRAEMRGPSPVPHLAATRLGAYAHLAVAGQEEALLRLRATPITMIDIRRETVRDARRALWSVALGRLRDQGPRRPRWRFYLSHDDWEAELAAIVSVAHPTDTIVVWSPAMAVQLTLALTRTSNTAGMGVDVDRGAK